MNNSPTNEEDSISGHVIGNLKATQDWISKRIEIGRKLSREFYTRGSKTIDPIESLKKQFNEWDKENAEYLKKVLVVPRSLSGMKVVGIHLSTCAMDFKAFKILVVVALMKHFWKGESPALLNSWLN